MSALARRACTTKTRVYLLISSTNDSQQTSLPTLAGQVLHDYQLVAAFNFLNFPTLHDRLSAISCIPSKDLTSFGLTRNSLKTRNPTRPAKTKKKQSKRILY